MWVVTITQSQPRERYTLTDTIRARFQFVENAKMFADLALEHAENVTVSIEWESKNYEEKSEETDDAEQ